MAILSYIESHFACLLTLNTLQQFKSVEQCKEIRHRVREGGHTSWLNPLTLQVLVLGHVHGPQAPHLCMGSIVPGTGRKYNLTADEARTHMNVKSVQMLTHSVPTVTSQVGMKAHSQPALAPKHSDLVSSDPQLSLFAAVSLHAFGSFHFLPFSSAIAFFLSVLLRYN